VILTIVMILITI